ncbi:MAG: IMP cyclohydrolase [Dissulfurimicrobium sp.]|uniref:IMP cyclohydrolase n=1 Tax=Dissulfurimicrobium sp. TaxID=2022436 RepID=UPI00404B9916
MKNLKEMYRTILGDQFPNELRISFGDQTLIYRKRTWTFKNEKTGALEERGLRYGENPDQEAALFELVNGNLVMGGCAYIGPGSGLVSAIDEAAMLQAGKHPSKINLTDIDNSLNILKFLMKRPAAVIVKHNNPCGVAYGNTLEEAFQKALRADRIAAFGGCVSLNRPVDKATAEALSAQYLEVVCAPQYEEGTVAILSRKKNLRIIEIRRIENLETFWDKRFVDFKSLIDGGLIIQQSPINRIRTKDDLKPAECEYQGRIYRTKRMPDEREYEDIIFGWSVEQGVTSNSVIYVKNGVTVGIGTGEQDRVGVAEIAVYKAYAKYADMLCYENYAISYKELELRARQGEKGAVEKKAEIDAKVKADRGGIPGSVMVSDAFFPFRDGVDVGIQQGVSAIVHPGGSLRDWEAIDACNNANPPVAMVFTGQRAFKH